MGNVRRKLARWFLCSTTLLLSGRAVGAATLPPGFQETIALFGLTQPTAVRFSPDGRVFVAEKSGRIKVFDSLTSTTPKLFADLSTEVDDYWDRGLLGIELHPNFPATPYVYVLYSYDAPIGGTAPTWNDSCPDPPGAETNGCVISGRLSRLTASGDAMTGTEEVLLEAWGQQFPSHSIGDLHFGPDGALYVSGGDGASYDDTDYGQYGDPINPLGDPPVPIGGTQAPPNAEGGALRSQSPRRTDGPALANGAILRLDDSGAALPDNPLAGSSDAMARRIIAYGLRNPFRFTIHPSSGEVWIGDVGSHLWEEIDRMPSATPSSPMNFGWPCYEGNIKESGFSAANLKMCEALYADPSSHTSPVFVYSHTQLVVPNETCPTAGGSSVSGITFYPGGRYPSSYDGALFFADYSRNCAWVMFPDGSGQPDPTTRTTFDAGASTPVDLEIGPGGDLYYVDIGGGMIHRIQYNAPTAVATADPTNGSAPLTVQFDGSGSQPAQAGDTLSYAWDLDGDGNFNDATGARPTFTYTSGGTRDIRLRVTDNHGVSTLSAPIPISVSNTNPVAFIDTPATPPAWKVGEQIAFSGHATDTQDGPLPPAALTWTVLLHHCPANCHIHTVQTFNGVASGSFPAPDHEYPSYLEIVLTARDSGGLTGTTRLRLDPATVTVTFQSSPTGLHLSVAGVDGVTPFARTVIEGSGLSLEAPTPQTWGGLQYGFASWSDGRARVHDVTAPASTTYGATYASSDLSVSVSGTPSACAGEALAYTLTVHNAGPTTASLVAVAIPLPNGVGLGSAGGDGWTCGGSPTVNCARAELDPGDAPPISLTAAAPPSAGTVTITATTSAGSGDPNSSNDTGNASTDVGPACGPVLAQIAPNDGPPTGATSVDLEGANFQPGAAVTIGGVAAGGVTVANASLISAMAPALPPGTLNDVVARNPNGKSSPLFRAYFSRFTDVPATHLFSSAVERLFRSGITLGCGGGNYCPADPVTRAQLAIFLLRGIHGTGYVPPPATGSAFDDVPKTSFGAAWIEELAREGITAGCGGRNFCPNNAVNRASMAVLLLRARKGSTYHPPPATGQFADVPANDPYASWIEELARENITSGCGPSTFCPTLQTTRGEMAAFLVRTFDLP